MPVPPFAAFWLPILRLVADGRVWTASELAEKLSAEFNLTAEDRSDRIPSGKTRLLDRTQWTITYLRQAGVVASPRRGTVTITERGRELLRRHPDKLDRTHLLQFQEYQDFLARKRQPSLQEPDADGAESETVAAGVETIPPHEVMDQAYLTILAALVDDVLSALKRLPPARFEQIVVDVLVAMGYGGTREDAANVVGRTGDGGIDGVI